MKNIIFTDGSSRGNPGPGGWGAVIVATGSNGEAERVRELGGREDNTTNNRMELRSVIEALSATEEDSDNVVHTDSSYLINGITKWVHGWKKNGWKTKMKEDVLNKDLWIRLDEEVGKRKVSFQHVGGHIGVSGNERCDVIATYLADNKDPRLYDGPLSQYPIKDILNISQKTVRKGNKKKSGVQAYSYISRVNGITEVHHSWSDCEKRVKGSKGARYKKATSKEEEMEIVKELTTEVGPQ